MRSAAEAESHKPGKLVIVCGLPGSGKTTYAQHLITRDGGLRFCPDDWILALGLDIWDEDRRSKIEALQWHQAQKLLAQGQTALIEWGTWGRSEREALRLGGREIGALVELHYLSAPLDVLYERIRARGMEDPPVTRADLARWESIFQVPTEEEFAQYDEARVVEHAGALSTPHPAPSLEFALRPFQAPDRDAVQDIRRRAFQPVWESFRKLLGDDIFQAEYDDADESQASYLDSLCQDESGKEVYVLLLSGHVVGFVGLSADLDRKRGQIDLNAVAPEHQGKGGGQFMYAFAVGRLIELGAAVVRVSTGNDSSHGPARRAYEGVGFDAAIPTITMYRLLRTGAQSEDPTRGTHFT
jgi:predicted kinase/GNAT superfamily N-acetyltransferase